MEIKLSDLDLFDLLSERHHWGRELIQEKWNQQSTIQLSITEWFILHLLYKETYTAVELSKIAEITRQATHKAIRKLENNELVVTRFSENNKRIKVVELTAFGKECYIKNKELKTKLENQIKENIGTEQFNNFKRVLALDWLLDQDKEVTTYETKGKKLRNKST